MDFNSRRVLYLIMTMSIILISRGQAQKLIGSWIEMSDESDKAQMRFINSSNLEIYVPDNESWFMFKYRLNQDTLFIKSKEVANCELPPYFIYRLTKDQLQLSFLNITEYLIKADVSKHSSRPNNLIISANRKQIIQVDTTSIKYDSIILGENSSLIFKSKYSSLTVVVNYFQTEIGARIIGKGAEGRSALKEINKELKHDRKIASLTRKLYDCRDGFDGRNGISGKDGSNGLSLSVFANEIKIKSLVVNLKGGNGENGENGEDGEDGGQGSCFCHGGNGGNPGLGGNGGNGGNGGDFLLEYALGEEPVSLVVDNNGGNPGSGGVNGNVGKGGRAVFYCSDFNCKKGFDGFIPIYSANAGSYGFEGKSIVNKVR